MENAKNGNFDYVACNSGIIILKTSMTRDEGRRGGDMDMTVHLRNETQVGGSVGEDYGSQQAKGNLVGGGTQSADLEHLGLRGLAKSKSACIEGFVHYISLFRLA